jgi:hypothetical protein
MAQTDFEATFRALKAIIEPFEPRLVRVHDAPDNYYLDTPHIQKNGQPLYFGSVRVGKKYVSFHLMPVYLWPELLEEISPELKRRMQGKSCFNFSVPDPVLFGELTELTRAGFDRYREAGYVA